MMCMSKIDLKHMFSAIKYSLSGTGLTVDMKTVVKSYFFKLKWTK